MDHVRVSADGNRVGFLRSGELRLLDVPTMTERALGANVDDYGIDRTGQLVTWTSAGRLHRTAPDPLGGSEIRVLTTQGSAGMARPDPTGRRICYLSDGALRVVLEDDADVLLAGEPAPVRWGDPDPHAHYFGRDEGWWWAPDGDSVLATRTSGEQVSLHLLDLDGGWVDVHWDREIYPYLGSVRWAEGGPLITVLRRSQAHGLVLAIDRRTGESQVHAELADPRWVNPVPGTPRHLADGRVLVGGEIAHDGYDARCLFADGTLLTPPGLYVRRVVGRLGPGAANGELGELLVEATEGDPAEQHLFRVRGTASGGMVVHRLTRAPGWHFAECGNETVLTGFRSLDHEGTQWTLWQSGEVRQELTGPLVLPAPAARPALDRVTDRRLATAVVYPDGHVFGRRLPVLLLLADAPTEQQVRADHSAFATARRWAAAGYAVVMVDGRGTLGVSPGFEKVTHRRIADLAVADQVDGLHALADKHSDLDLSRVVALGHDYGGWLAELLAVRRPEVVRAAAAVRPWDWSTLPVALAERYLGPREFDSDVYARHQVDEVTDAVLVQEHLDEAAARQHFAARLD
jgi:dipeptidyl-peptidase-4